MFKQVLVSSFSILALGWAVASHGDSTPTLPTITPSNAVMPEPITGTPIKPNKGSESPPVDRFALHDPGPPEAIWKYEDLTPAERRVVDRGRDVSGWANIHAQYNAALQERQPLIRASAAASQLGAHDLATLGVVP